MGVRISFPLCHVTRHFSGKMVKKSVIEVTQRRKILTIFASSMNINRIITAVAAAVVAVCLNAQTTMTLTGRQQALVGIAANEAKGDIDALRAALNEGFEQGLTLSEAKEALPHSGSRQVFQRPGQTRRRARTPAIAEGQSPSSPAPRH